MRPVAAATDSFDLVVELTRDDSLPAQEPAPILHVAERGGSLVFDATQVSQQLMAELPLRGNRWRLHSPKWIYRGLLDIPPHRRWVFHWTWHRGTLQLESGPADGSAPRIEVARTLSVATGWLLIHPFVTVVGDRAALWTTMWLAWWFGMLGWLAGWLPARPRWGYGSAALVAFAVCLRWGGLAPDRGRSSWRREHLPLQHRQQAGARQALCYRASVEDDVERPARLEEPGSVTARNQHAAQCCGLAGDEQSVRRIQQLIEQHDDRD